MPPEGDAEGRSYWPDESVARRSLCPDLSEADAHWAYERLRPQAPTAQRERHPSGLPAARSVSLVCAHDAVVNPEYSRRATRERLGVASLQLDAGHFPMLTAGRARRRPIVPRVSLAERTEPFTVADGLLTDVGGTLPARVLSTPGMIAMMERTAARLAAEHLADGRPTVGFEVCIKHVAGAGEGAECTATARLLEVAEGRKLRFEVEVREGDRVLGLGTHERRALSL